MSKPVGGGRSTSKLAFSHILPCSAERSGGLRFGSTHAFGTKQFLLQLHKTLQGTQRISNKLLQAAIADLSSIPGADDSDEPAPANKPAPVLFPLRAGGGTVVHAVVLIAAVRRLSRQLLFADLLPPGSDRDSDRSIWQLG